MARPSLIPAWAVQNPVTTLMAEPLDQFSLEELARVW